MSYPTYLLSHFRIYKEMDKTPLETLPLVRTRPFYWNKINRKTVETMPTMWSHSCPVQEQEGFHTPLLMLFTPATGGLTLLFHIQPSPLEEKTAKKGIKLKRTRFYNHQSLLYSWVLATIQGWQMEKEWVLEENGRLSSRPKWSEGYGCVWLTARQRSFSGRPRNSEGTPEWGESEYWLCRCVGGQRQRDGSWFTLWSISDAVCVTLLSQTHTRAFKVVKSTRACEFLIWNK